MLHVLICALQICKSLMRNLNYVYYLILLLSSFVAIKNFKVLNVALKFFALLVLVTTVIELLAFNFAITRKNNLYIYIIFMPIQMFLVNLAYFSYHFDTLYRKIVIALTSVFIFCFIVVFKDFSCTEFPTKLMMIENLIIFFIVTYSIFLIIRKEHYNEIRKNNLIWINMGFVFFLSITFFIWGFNFLFITSEINIISRFTLIISNIILYSTMAFTFFRAGSISERV